MENERSSIGYETDPNLLPLITKKIGKVNPQDVTIKIIQRKDNFMADLGNY